MGLKQKPFLIVTLIHKFLHGERIWISNKPQEQNYVPFAKQLNLQIVVLCPSIYYLLSTFYYLLSAFCFLLSTFYFLLSAFCFLLSAFYFTITFTGAFGFSELIPVVIMVSPADTPSVI